MQYRKTLLFYLDPNSRPMAKRGKKGALEDESLFEVGERR